MTLRTPTRLCWCTAWHALRVLEDFQAISVKQWSFLGTENDKVNVEVKR